MVVPVVDSGDSRNVVVPWSLGVVMVLHSYRTMHIGACVHLHTDEGEKGGRGCRGGGQAVSGKGAMKEKEKEEKEESGRQAGSLYLANLLKELVHPLNL